jgi:protein tyrosine/serine phosphatase
LVVEKKNYKDVRKVGDPVTIIKTHTYHTIPWHQGEHEDFVVASSLFLSRYVGEDGPVL